MSKTTDKHPRIRVLPENWKALKKLKSKTAIPGSIPSIANTALTFGIEEMEKRFGE